MYRKPGGEGPSAASAFKEGGWKWLLYLLTGLLFLLMVIWCLVLLYVLIDQVADLQKSQRHISNQVDSLSGATGDGDGAADGGGDGSSDGGTGDGSGSTVNNYNTVNNVYGQSFTYVNANPVDDLITSVFDNGFACNRPPVIDSLPDPQVLFADAVRRLESDWQLNMIENDIPGLSITAVYTGQLIYSGNFGLANVSSNEPVTESTVFRLGAITKIFTTLLAFVARENGTISLDTPLSTLIPGFSVINPFNSRPVTVRHVLSSLSGLPRNAPPGCEPFDCNMTTAQVLQLLNNANFTLINPPLVKPANSDLGFALIGRGLEIGNPLGTYENMVLSEILGPLNMTNGDTGFDVSMASFRDRIAAGYEDGDEVPADIDNGWMRPFAGLYSSQRDMVPFLAFLNLIDPVGDGPFPRILGAQPLREMYQPAFMNPDSKTGWGTPFQLMYFKNRLLRTLAGDFRGYSSHLLIVPDLRLSILAMANAEVDASIFTLSAASALMPIIEKVLAEEVSAPAAAPNASNFVGNYLGQDDEDIPRTFSIQDSGNGVLRAYDSRYGNQVWLDMSWQSDNSFKLRWNGNPLELSCLTIQSSGADDDVLRFTQFDPSGHALLLLFQGEDYALFVD